MGLGDRASWRAIFSSDIRLTGVYQRGTSAKTEDNFERFLHGEMIDVVRGFIHQNMPAYAKISNTGGFHGTELFALHFRDRARVRSGVYASSAVVANER